MKAHVIDRRTVIQTSGPSGSENSRNDPGRRGSRHKEQQLNGEGEVQLDISTRLFEVSAAQHSED